MPHLHKWGLHEKSLIVETNGGLRWLTMLLKTAALKYSGKGCCTPCSGKSVMAGLEEIAEVWWKYLCQICYLNYKCNVFSALRLRWEPGGGSHESMVWECSKMVLQYVVQTIAIKTRNPLRKSCYNRGLTPGRKTTGMNCLRRTALIKCTLKYTVWSDFTLFKAQHDSDTSFVPLREIWAYIWS